jgi:carboxypeptidase C (cathepsin A)
VDVDGAVFRDFVMRYTAVNNRGTSPKFLYGESYGGPRSAVLADLLESAGVHLSGVVLQSPALNYNSNCGIIIEAIACSGYLPSYGAIASWFNIATPSTPPAQLPALMTQLRPFSDDEYAPAVVAFMTLGTRPDPLMITRLVAVAGLTPGQWMANFNMNPEYYRINLQPGTLSGRYDARVTLPNNSAPGQEIDPSDVLIGPSFAQRLQQYLSGTLGYTTPSTYTMLSNAIGSWNFSHDGASLPDTVPDLASAMAQNPRLKVLAVNGYHDLATPFHTTERDLARLNNPNVRVINYVGGHMTYLENASRRAMKADLAEFYRSALQ